MLKFNFQDIDFNNIGAWPFWLKTSAIATTGLLIIILFYWFVISDQMDKLDTLVSEEHKLKQTFISKQKMLVNIFEYKKQLKIIDERFNELVKLLPSDSEVPDLVNQVTKAGQDSGLKFKEITMLPEKKLKYYVELPIQIKVTGTYHQFGDFVSKVSSLPRIITFHDFKLDVINDPTSNLNKSRNNLEFDIQAKTYRYLADSATGTEQPKQVGLNNGVVDNNAKDKIK